MNFFLTNYLYPLSETFALSTHLRVLLDNPRTDQEVSAVAEYIRTSNQIESAFQLSESVITQILVDFFIKLSKTDEYVNNLFKLYGQSNPFELLARIWIIARFDDEGERERINQEAENLNREGHHGFFILEYGNPIVEKSGELIDYCHLVSLLVHTNGQEYGGRSFLLNYHRNWFQQPAPNHFACIQIFIFMQIADMESNDEIIDSERWLFFPSFRDDLSRVVALLDDVIAKNLKEKLLYIAELLRVAGHDITDDRIVIVVLVSIIELLLTHNPDTNRFNVEDSINKQFRLKAATVIYLNNKLLDLNNLKNRLREIYGLRSSIAHGDFKEVTKFVEGARKKDENFSLDIIVNEIYVYLRAIVFEYLRDYKFIDFLKEN
jgi:hypothetical protein